MQNNKNQKIVMDFYNSVKGLWFGNRFLYFANRLVTKMCKIIILWLF